MYNAIALQQLPGRLRSFKAKDTGPKHTLSTISSAESTLYVKVGAPVIITANLHNGLVNGTRATVTDIHQDNIYIKTDDNQVYSIERHTFDRSTRSAIAIREQFPLQLAYSLTVHRAQGLTLPKVHFDCDGMFERSQLYVAISRVRDPHHITLSNLDYSLLTERKTLVDSFLDDEYTEDDDYEVNDIIYYDKFNCF